MARGSSDMQLSICVPTYNRAGFLYELLQSIVLNPPGHSVEVCISDNCSTDATEEVVRRCQKSANIPIRYHRNSENRGPDYNYLKAVELAHGDYCWLMGSDDQLPPRAISTVRNQLKFAHDIYLLNRIDCDLNMKPRKPKHWLRGCTSSKVFFFRQNHDDDLIHYFKKADSLGAVFSYLSSIIVKKTAWDRQPRAQTCQGTGYAHVDILLHILRGGSSLSYVADPLVKCRHGNDSFAANGYLHRRMIDLDGYALLAQTHFKNSSRVRNAFLRIMTREHGLLALVQTRSLCAQSEWIALKHSRPRFRTSCVLPSRDEIGAHGSRGSAVSIG